MRFSILALDYDGTVARNGPPDLASALAIRDARAALADEIGRLEESFRQGRVRDLSKSLTKRIQNRYELRQPK